MGVGFARQEKAAGQHGFAGLKETYQAARDIAQQAIGYSGNRRAG